MATVHKLGPAHLHGRFNKSLGGSISPFGTFSREVITDDQFDRNAELPTEFVNVDSMPPVTGATHLITNKAQLTSALLTCNDGDEIVIDSGSIIEDGVFTLRKRTNAAAYVIIRCNTLSDLPWGVRVMPSDAPSMEVIG